MRPLIGIHAGVGAETQRPIFFNNSAYIHAVEKAGGVPILIPIFDDLNGLKTLLPRLDGLLLSGGIDVDPHNYQEEHHPLLGPINPQLDSLELELVRWTMREKIPTLGICRGMQVLNVALGGSLYQDLEAQFSGSLKHGNWDLPRNRLVHMIKIQSGSRMEQILGVRSIASNSLHHQAAKRPGKGVVLTGYAEDGVAEMLEVPEHPFMVAAQCHPEEISREEPTWTRLFSAFITACIQFALHRSEIEAVTTVDTVLTAKAV
jgi:putative glutamine amidotransferase